MRTNVCACATQKDWSIESVNLFLMDHGEKGMRVMNEFVESLQQALQFEDPKNAIVHYRLLLQETVPCRVEPCPLNIMTCCGMCIRRCRSRCVMDTAQRAYLYVYGYGQQEYSAAILRQYLCQEPDYKALAESVKDFMITSDKYGAKKYLKDEPKWTQLRESSQRFNYAPANDISYDPDTNIYDQLYWPQSGLCPFCIPPIKQKKGKKKG